MKAKISASTEVSVSIIMKLEELHQIENALGITFSEIYKQVMVDYPFKEDAGTINWSLWDDSGKITEWNLIYRNGYGPCPEWSKNYYLIGSEGDACPLAINLESGIVIKTNHGRVCEEPLEEYESFEEYLAFLKANYDN